MITWAGLVMAVAGARGLVVGAVDEPGPAPDRRALLVGVSQYPEGQGWPALPGAVKDVDSIAGVLIERFGFAKEDVLVLKDAQATGAAILKAFDRHLVQGADEHTVALFFFAGHGSQVLDRDGDEADGLDETLCPYDSVAQGDVRKDITDDQLAQAFARLRAKTPQVVALFDCCHSGTLMRSSGDCDFIARRAPRERGVEGIRPTLAGSVPGNETFAVAGAPALDLGDRAVVFSACLDDQSALESCSLRRGLFSTSLEKALRNVQPGDTWLDVHRQVQGELRRYGVSQDPLIHGAAGLEVFGARFDSSPTRFGVKSPVSEKSRVVSVLVEAGGFQGLEAGCRLQLRPADPRCTVLDAVVTDVRGPSACHARLETPLSEADWKKRGPWTASIVEGVSPELKISLALASDLVKDPALAPVLALRDAGRWFRAAGKGERPDLLIVRGSAGFVVGDASRQPILPHPCRPRIESVQQLVSDLESYAAHRAVLGIADRGSALRDSLEVDVSWGWFADKRDRDSFREDPAMWSRGSSGQWVADCRLHRESTKVACPGLILRVKNQGSRPVYVSLLSLWVSWKVCVAAPAGNARTRYPHGIFVPPGGVHPIMVRLDEADYRIASERPLQETLKLFVSDAPIDFLYVQSHGIADASPPPPTTRSVPTAADTRLSQLLRTAGRGKTRAAAPPAVPSDWTCYSYGISLIPRPSH